MKGIYGYRRMQLLLKRKYGIHINHKRVYRLMKQMGLLAVIRRKKRKFYSHWAHHRVPNLLNRNFHATRPNQKWVTNMTELTVNGQRVYLSVILDLFNNEVVSYNLGRHPSLNLVVQTLNQAVTKTGAENVILHSDQGGQYASGQYAAVLQRYGIKQSMSRRGNGLDNAAMESFFGHLKSRCSIPRKSPL